MAFTNIIKLNSGNSKIQTNEITVSKGRVCQYLWAREIMPVAIHSSRKNLYVQALAFSLNSTHKQCVMAKTIIFSDEYECQQNLGCSDYGFSNTTVVMFLNKFTINCSIVCNLQNKINTGQNVASTTKFIV